MTRSRLILVLRVCLLLALAVWLYPSWLFLMPVALFMPVFDTLCGNCTTAFKSQYQIVIRNLSAITGAFANCTDCSSRNGTYTVTQSSSPPSLVPGGACYAEAAINPCLCADTRFPNWGAGQKFGLNRIAFWVTTGGNAANVALMQNSAGTDCTVFNTTANVIYGWTKDTTGSGETDCANYSSLALAIVTHGQCVEGSPSSCLVTAI